MPPMSKNRHLPFNPPRKVSAAGESSAAAPKRRGQTKRNDPSSSTSATNKSKRRNVQKSPSPAPEPTNTADSASGSSSARGSKSPSPEPDYILAEITTTGDDNDDIMTSDPKVPSKLATALLHHHFQDDKTRITKDATKMYSKYLEIFVREAVARAVYERKEGLDTDAVGTNRIQTMMDSYLEVEDLEKLVPQLLMDF